MTAALELFAFLIGFFPPVSVAGAYAALAGFLVLAAVAHAKKIEPFVPARTFFDGPVLFFLGVWLLSSLFGTAPLRSLGKAAAQCRFVAFYALLWVGGGRHRGAALKGYLWGAGAAVAYGLLQYAATRLALHPWSQEMFLRLDGGAAHYASIRDGRVHAGVHPITYAELLLPLFFLGTAYFLEGGRGRLARGAAWVFFSGAAILLSQSRGPWMGILVGTAVLFLWHPRRWFLIGPFVLLGAVFLSCPELRSRASTLEGLHAGSSPGGTIVEGGSLDVGARHRLILWNNAWQVARRHPVLGVGPRNLQAAVRREGDAAGFLPNPRGMDGDAHNQYLQHFAERGAPGLAALLGLLAAPLWASFRLLRGSPGTSSPRWVLWGLLAFYAAFLVANVTERAFDDAEPALAFWVLSTALVPLPERERVPRGG